MKTFSSFREETLYEATAHEKVLAHPAVHSVDNAGKGDYFVNLKKGWHYDGQRSFGNENAKAALKVLQHVEQGDIEESVSLHERGADSKGYYRSTESGAGLTSKGAKHFGIHTAVTTKPSKLKAGSKAANRRKSFCARMSGMPGPMKDEKGRPTRKAASLRRWHCGS